MFETINAIFTVRIQMRFPKTAFHKMNRAFTGAGNIVGIKNSVLLDTWTCSGFPGYGIEAMLHQTDMNGWYVLIISLLKT